ncbi:MFS transporter [Porticoccus litoralis]|uniref:MFS transporter n=1 Tax=Porticoccus litoralis TaxID=434086 RepID=A0AAW8AZU2_9GAMM|nr:MFS transporter [Porticoccus litoralis]MDP1519382.1 MFS transporter [Porticoccus litoralis]
MLTLIVPICALLIGIGLLLLGTGLLNTLLALRGGLEGYSDSVMGLIMSGYFVGFIVGTFLALPLIKRIGHIRAFAFCAAFTSCFALLHLVYIHPVMWFLLRVATGTTLVILYTVVESWLNGQTAASQRGKVFAVYMIVNLVALAATQQFLRLAGADSFLLFALAAIFISTSVASVTWTRMLQPEVNNVARMKLSRLWQLAPVAVAGGIFSGLAMGAFWGLSAVFASRVGLDSTGVATFITVAILGGAVFQYPFGRYSDSHDRRKVLLAISAAGAVAAMLLAAMSFAGGWLLVAGLLFGGLAFAIYPVAVAHLVDHLEGDEILPGGSTLLLIHGTGAAIGPALAGFLMEMLGPQALPLYFFTMLLALALFTWRKLAVKVVDEAENPTQFVAMVRTTPTALEMHPDEHIQDETVPSEAPDSARTE